MSGARFGPRSIRLQVVAVVAICVLVMVAVVAALAGTGSMTAAREQLRQESLVRLDVALAAADLSGVAMPDSYTGRADLPAGLRDRGDGVYTYFDGQAMWASRLAQSDRDTISVRLSARPLEEQAATLRRTFGLAAAVAILISCAVGWMLAGSVTGPLRRAAGALRAEPERALPVEEDAADEVAVLVRRVNELRDGLQRSLEGERAFTADVAHELRTPLTTLVTAASMIDDPEVGPMVQRQTQRLRELVESLLTLARSRADAARVASTPTDLAELTRSVLDEVLGPGEGRLDVAGDTTLISDPVLLRQLVVNLVANAARHGAPPIDVVVDGTSVTVSDHGPGFPEALLAEGPQRFQTFGRTGGSGLGLTIAALQADLLGARLDLSNTPEGARARVAFGAGGRRPDDRVAPARRTDA